MHMEKDGRPQGVENLLRLSDQVKRAWMVLLSILRKAFYGGVMKVYMKVMADKYELPIAIADSPKELAEMVGVKANSISSQITRAERGYLTVGKALYHRVEIGRVDEEDG